MDAASERVMMQMRAALERALAPSALEIIDDGPRHAGHLAAGGGHFRLLLVAEAFRGRSRLERHRMVYAALAPLLKASVHALNIKARAPEEKD
ncbi:MAG TPA: BolA family protein [Steroidobacteraceae bacterium]|jgi:BolA protein|nr:BolA family protein [Steroidobacteraceae bacterium]